MNLRPLLASTLLLAACATTPTAPVDSTAAKFKSYDLNNDGALDRAEFSSAYAEARFRFFDANGDGAIDRGEWARVLGDDRPGRFESVNTSKSGRISLAEWKASPVGEKNRMKVFNRIDKAKNGKLTLAEVRAALEAREQYKP